MSATLPAMIHRILIRGVVLVWVALASGRVLAGEASAAGANRPGGSRTVVLWISLDGFRPDYLDRAETPRLHRLMKQGAYSRQLIPIFPSQTFPSHASQATGVGVSEHGIPDNLFYDSRIKQSFRYPDGSSLLEAEPIWVTATRQGVRVALVDWPLSYAQKGQWASAYFQMRFDSSATDEQRLDRLLEIWRKDTDARPLQLLMGYTTATDPPGHNQGPDAPETLAAATAADTAVGRFLDEGLAIFKRKMRAEDRLVVLVSSDHGMAAVHTLVNFQKLFAKPLPPEVRVVSGHVIANVFLDGVPEGRRAGVATEIVDALKKRDFLIVYRREELPAEWHFAHPDRTGDIVVIAKHGCAFNAKRPVATFEPGPVNGPFGMHGYPPAGNPDMAGMLIVWQYPQMLGGKDLGRVEGLQLHPTVAALLGIVPSAAAKAKPIAVEGMPAAKVARPAATEE